MAERAVETRGDRVSTRSDTAAVDSKARHRPAQQASDDTRFVKFRAAVEDPKQASINRHMWIQSTNDEIVPRRRFKIWWIAASIVATMVIMVYDIGSIASMLMEKSEVLADSINILAGDRSVTEVDRDGDDLRPVRASPEAKPVEPDMLVAELKEQVDSLTMVNEDLRGRVVALEAMVDRLQNQLLDSARFDGADPGAPSAVEDQGGVAEAGQEYLLQIAILKERDDLGALWRSFAADFAAHADRLQPYVAEVQSDGGILHAVYAGPFENQRAAASLCEEMRRRGGDCIVVQR